MSFWDCKPKTTRDGQFFLVHCDETNLDGIWSPSEEGTFSAWESEHRGAHYRQERDAERRQMARFMRASAHHIYRTTEPGNPLRRGIAPYL